MTKHFPCTPEQSGASFYGLCLLSALLLMLTGCASDTALDHLNRGSDAKGLYWDRDEMKLKERPCQPSVAIAEYTQAIEMTLDPKAVAGLNNEELASAYFQRGDVKRECLNDHKGALEDYNEAIKRYEQIGGGSSLPSAYSARSKSKEQLGDSKGAIDDYWKFKDLMNKSSADYSRKSSSSTQQSAQPSVAPPQSTKHSRGVNAFYCLDSMVGNTCNETIVVTVSGNGLCSGGTYTLAPRTSVNISSHCVGKVRREAYFAGY